MSLSKRKLSIIVGCYNEAGNIQEMYRRLLSTLDPLGCDLEIIYIDNDSADGSENIFRDLAARDSRVKVIFMSRNFGSAQPSYFAGLEHCSGDAAVTIDGDLQDPPEVIAEFLKKWQAGYDVVYGVRKKRVGPIIRRIAYKLFYRIFRKLSYLDIPLDAGEFALLDRKVINELIKFPEHEILMRGLRAYVGFRQIGVDYARAARASGKSSTSFLKDINWAKKFIINFSYKPLDWISYTAFFAFLIALVGITVNLILYISNPGSPPGVPTLIFGLLFFGAVQLLAIAVIGEYLGRIMHEVKKRPRFIIREILNDKEKLK